MAQAGPKTDAAAASKEGTAGVSGRGMVVAVGLWVILTRLQSKGGEPKTSKDEMQGLDQNATSMQE